MHFDNHFEEGGRLSAKERNQKSKKGVKFASVITVTSLADEITKI
jgi:hypothetical protein